MIKSSIDMLHAPVVFMYKTVCVIACHFFKYFMCGFPLGKLAHRVKSLFSINFPYKMLFLWVLSAIFCVACFTGHAEILPDSPPRIFFLHIPKTGGVSFHQFLSTHYHVSQIVPQLHKYPHSFQTLFSDPSINYIGGHMPYRRVKDFVEKEHWKVVTLFRHPIKRLLSRMRFEKKYKQLFHEGMPQWRENPTQLYFLFSELNPYDPTISIKEHLESAKKTLSEKIFFIAILEKLEESLFFLTKTFNWHPPFPLLHFNTTEQWYQDYPQSVINELIENNQEELELYQFALELYEKQKNKIVSDSLFFNTPSPKFSEIHYTCDQPFVGYGWCAREKIPSLSYPHWFYWIGHQENASLVFPLKEDQNYQLFCNIQFTENVSHLLKICVNNHPIRFRILNSDSKWHLLKGDIPAQYIKGHEETFLTFEIIDPTRPFQLDPYRGRLAICSLDIVPNAPLSPKNLKRQHRRD